jgi:L-amino acid N-acyltransferase YncA
MRPSWRRHTSPLNCLLPSRDEVARRIKDTAERLPWLVAVQNDRVLGYAYAAPHSARDADTWSVDTSVYLDAAIQGRGLA